MIRTVMVALDGSEHAGRALALAADIALRYGAGLHLVHVVGPLRVTEDLKEFARIERLDNAALADMARGGQSILAAAQAGAVSKGVQDIRTAALRGDPAEELLGYAREHGIDLLVMGRRGLGRIQGLLMGSVSSKVTGLADCPVVTVK